MTRQDFEKKYIELYLAYTNAGVNDKNRLKGLLKQMDVQRYFEDYNDRSKGSDCVWNSMTFEVKTGYRVTIARNHRYIDSDWVVWTPSTQIGSVTDWRVYKTEDFIDAVYPYCQNTWAGHKGYDVCKMVDGREDAIQRVLDEAKFYYLDTFIKEFENVI